MYLKPELWAALHNYFFIELKLSEKASSVQSLRSRFFVLTNYLSQNNLPFNKKTFNEFISYKKELGAAPSYLNGYITLAKYLDKYFDQREFKEYSYFPTSKKINFEILSPDEIQAIAEVEISYQKMSEFINKRQRALVLFLGTTGCRIGEALELRKSDLQESPCYVVFRDTKNNSDRLVPIAPFIMELLKDISSNEFVFTSARGGKLDLQQVNLDLKRRALAVGIKKPVWNHLFRHSFITTMLESGVDFLDVAVLVGHTDPKSTMRYKNSQLSHYADIMNIHPLLRERLSIDVISKRMRDLMEKLVDRKNYSIESLEMEDGFTLRVQKYLQN